MSGPIVPPLTVSDEADGGSVSGRPITTIEVSSGTLTVSGRTATLDTSGSGGSPATPANSIQFNSDPAGTFTGSSQLLYQTAANVGRIEMSSGAVATQPEIRTMTGRGLQISATDADESIRNQIVVFGENDAPDGIALYPATGLYVQVGDSTSTPAQITSRGATANLVLTTNLTEDKAKITLTAGADGDILVQTDNTGVLQLENTTTDADSVLSIMGNGAGDAKLDLQNASKRVWVLCDENKKLKIQGGAAGNTFVFDVSSASGGITFPDASVQTTAASGGVSTLAGLTDVSMDITNFTDGLLIQTNSGGSAPSTGTLSGAENNLGIGADVFSALQSGAYNVALGGIALEKLTSAATCTAVGYGSMAKITTQADNTGLGFYAGFGIENGGNNTAIGSNVLRTTNSGTQNTGCGASALNKASGGNSNCALGYRALYNVTGAHYNTGCGTKAGDANTGAYNLFLGYEAGVTLSTASNCVIIGGVAADSDTNDDQLVIGSGDAGIFWIKGDSAGSCYQGDNAATWSTTSDQRLKREIADTTVGLDAINTVRVCNFRYVEKADPIMETRIDEDGEEREVIVGYDGENRYNLDPEPERVGVIAQELQEVFPDAVKENAHGHLTVSTDSINWALLKAVQELSAKVEALEASQ